MNFYHLHAGIANIDIIDAIAPLNRGASAHLFVSVCFFELFFKMLLQSYLGEEDLERRDNNITLPGCETLLKDQNLSLLYHGLSYTQNIKR